MEIYTTQRPALLPDFCAPASGAADRVRASLPQVHQVLIQSELVRNLVPTTAESNGTNGSRGSKGITVAFPAAKWMTDARGVPPRGRPV